jgi:hypothetical protein
MRQQQAAKEFKAVGFSFEKISVTCPSNIA